MTTNVLSTKIRKDVDKILKTSNLKTTNNLNTKVNEVKNKIPNHDKYITTTTELNELTAENFVVRLKQANLVTKPDFDNKLTSYNRQITPN